MEQIIKQLFSIAEECERNKTRRARECAAADVLAMQLRAEARAIRRHSKEKFKNREEAFLCLHHDREEAGRAGNIPLQIRLTDVIEKIVLTPPELWSRAAAKIAADADGRGVNK